MLYIHTYIHYIHTYYAYTYRRRNTRKASDQKNGRTDRHIGRREKQKRQAVTQEGKLTNGQAGGQAGRQLGPRKTKGQPAKIGERSCPGGRDRARKHRQKSAKRATKSGITDTGIPHPRVSASPKPAQTCKTQKQKIARSKAGAVPGSTVRVGQKHRKNTSGSPQNKKAQKNDCGNSLYGGLPPGGREL